MKKILCLTVVLLITCMHLFAQESSRLKCAADAQFYKYFKENPGSETAFELQQNYIEHEMKVEGALGDNDDLIIPVVVHILYENDVDSIPESRILAQLETLNEDFRRLNADAINTPDEFADVAVDVHISFCLATYNELGFPTTGIFYHHTTKSTYIAEADEAYDTDEGGITIWDHNQYLNILVVPQLETNDGEDLCGYSYIPANPGLTAYNDGVQVDVDCFNSGLRTLTHEVGHWFNLFHIWGKCESLDIWGCTNALCGTDNCGDTPNQDGPTSGCPSFPNFSCADQPNGDMFMNYMDYSSDACQNLFTYDQKSRMRNTFTGVFHPRKDLTTSGGFCPVTKTITGTLTFSTDPYSASSSITSDAIISSGITTGFKAGDYIVLNPEFVALMGSVFTAEIGDCCSNTNPEFKYQEQDVRNIAADNTFDAAVMPNPFIDRTNLSLTLHESTLLLIELYDISGRFIQTIVSNEQYQGGSFNLVLDLQNYTEGIYFVRIQTANDNLSLKIIKQ